MKLIWKCSPDISANKITDYDKACDVLFKLVKISTNMEELGIPKPYILKLRLAEWKKMVEYLSLHKILSAFRLVGIKGVDVFTSYGMKKIRIWL